MQNDNGKIKTKKTKRNPSKDVKLTLRHHLIPLSPKELELQVDNIISFLKLVHPHTGEGAYSDAAIEVRPVKRDNDEFEFVPSYSTFKLTEAKDRELLMKLLSKVNGKGFCVFYSIFAFDYHKDVFKADGSKFTKGHINKDNALFTTTLVADFDGITAEDFNKQKALFESVGIKTYDISTGHGYHSLVFLDRRCYDITILEKFTTLLLSKGFRVDTAMKGGDRLARAPFTTNCKELDDNKNPDVFNASTPLAIPINDYEEIVRYSVVDVFKALNNLETVIALNNAQKNEVSHQNIVEVEETQSKAIMANERIVESGKKQIQISLTDAEYLYDDLIDFNELPITVRKILASSTPQGYRNETLKFLTPTLKEGVGLTLEETQNILARWGCNCEPALDEDFTKNEVRRFWRYINNHKQGYYSQKLVDLYGYLDLAVIKENDMIAVPHHLINIMREKSVNPGVVRTYMLLLLHFHENEDVSNVTAEEAASVVEISSASINRHIDVLVRNGLLIKRKANVFKKNGGKYTYYLSPVVKLDGCRKISATTIEAVYFSKRNPLTDGEAMVFLYLKLMVAYAKKKNVFTSQEKIAEALNKTRVNITQTTNALHEKKFIKKETIGEAFFKRTTYEIKK